MNEETKIFIEIANKIETELLAKYPEHKCIDAMLSTCVRLAGSDVIEMAADYLEAETA
tara:strand:- start:91 stop:264 length:174 start_codon:yes stop_codon:yes gene_type:complete